MDYYEIFKCTPDTPIKQIHTEYRRLALQYHPDRTKTISPHRQLEYQQMWNKIQEAYGVLSDPIQRAQYNRWRTSHLPIGFDQWKSRSYTMHWSFDNKRYITDKSDDVLSSQDLYAMFRSYKI
ncbi:DnaJ-domain-containing protein [Coemansia reversa NRRL 1564]|uniref:DnaJ-domain-containing protein n=1 Tax=Coemansia reversa (strain ATCC 12441 / NRRL 1564) TaxID=763665 RepID=A0A2G5B2E3_COERN|nr:DnaJ-domain-containing protein [Coemansia reversa NRRL 1564]|eukprot:PIA13188.1 DnaJ-domain-containing protein [Coemansia reversa NRRL 1564]